MFRELSINNISYLDSLAAAMCLVLLLVIVLVLVLALLTSPCAPPLAQLAPTCVLLPPTPALCQA